MLLMDTVDRREDAEEACGFLNHFPHWGLPEAKWCEGAGKFHLYMGPTDLLTNDPLYLTGALDHLVWKNAWLRDSRSS